MSEYFIVVEGFSVEAKAREDAVTELSPEARYSFDGQSGIIRIWQPEWTMIVPMNRLVVACLPNHGPTNVRK